LEVSRVVRYEITAILERGGGDPGVSHAYRLTSPLRAHFTPKTAKIRVSGHDDITA
jgi:hypothetical protein